MSRKFGDSRKDTIASLAACLLASAASVRPNPSDSYGANYVAGTLIELNDNGAWSWFMDPRAIIDNGRLIVGSVRTVGKYQQNMDHPRWGNVEGAVYDMATAKPATTVLHQHLEQDDHDAPAFLEGPDGRYMAMYSKHGAERRMHYRISEAHNALAWGTRSCGGNTRV